MLAEAEVRFDCEPVWTAGWPSASVTIPDLRPIAQESTNCVSAPLNFIVDGYDDHANAYTPKSAVVRNVVPGAFMAIPLEDLGQSESVKSPVTEGRIPEED